MLSDALSSFSEHKFHCISSSQQIINEEKIVKILNTILSFSYYLSS